MKIVTADGRTVDKAHMNAWAAEPELEGVRITISIGKTGVVASVHPEDRDAVACIAEDQMDGVLRRASEMAVAGEVDMCDDREVEAWIA